MSLSDLVEHIPAQKEKIRSISSGLTTETAACDYWSRLREIFWGKDASQWQVVENIDRGDDPVPDHRIPDGPPDSCTVAKLPKFVAAMWGIDSEKILVRTDYHEALNTAVLANNARVTVFVVGGQPGIGELPFLSTVYSI